MLHQIPTGRARYLSAELTPDGKEILAAGFDGVVTWNMGSGKISRTFRKYERNVVWAARMSLDRKRVVAGNGGCHLDIWDAKTQKRKFELETKGIVTRTSLSRDGKRAVTASQNQVLSFWDLEKGKLIFQQVEKKSIVIAAAISANGETALYGGTDGVVRLIDLASQKEIKATPGKGWIESIEASADGRFFISAGRDKTVMIWDANANHVRTLRGFSRTIVCAHISHDGSRVLATGGGPPMVWDAASGEVLEKKVGDGKVYSARFSHDGKNIVTVENDSAGNGNLCVY